MSNSRQRTTVHSQVISAPAQAVFELVADVTRWPAIFAPSLHVHHLELAEHAERFQLWALVNGQVKTWTSRRTRDPRQLHIGFAQERTPPPFASMGGEWTFRALAGNRSEAILTHHFTAVDGESLDALTRAVDHNSEQELAALGQVAQLGHPVPEVVFSFEDTVHLDGSAPDAYHFVYRSDRWPQRLPHVSRVVLREESPGVPHPVIQDMEMDTVTANGSAHTTRSIRLCFATDQIVYKQLVPPALLFGHSGGWIFADGPDGPMATARHTVSINPDAIPEVLGNNHTLADARDFLRSALGANSRATLAHASTYARSRVPLSSGRAGG
jgi:ribosome-associated toxin RatA of RatAB toxin-antitoxin module